MNKRQLLAMVLFASLSVKAITLNDCLHMAHDNYPAIKQFQMIEQTCNFTLENASKGWLPQVSVSAGAYAFTDIIKSNGLMKSMGGEMKNYVANGSVVVRQNVYDGGQIAAQKGVASAQSEVQRNQLNVSMYGVNERVLQIYFGILLLDEQIARNELHQKDFMTSENNIRSMMKGGIANLSDLDAILVEGLKLKQQKSALVSSRQVYLDMLGVFIGKKIQETEPLEKPMAEMTAGMNRPELQYYASQNILLDAQRQLLNTRLRPTVCLFGMGMYHSNVSDLLNKGVLAGGITLSWNIGALYTRKNDIRNIEREVFLFNNTLQNKQENGTIASLRQQIAQDEEIVRLCESIRIKGEKKVLSGTESVNELVRDINAVNHAKAQMTMHEIQLLHEIYKLKNINNN